MSAGNWYISAEATEQYMDIMGMRGDLDDRNPEYRAALAALIRHSQTARQVETDPKTYRDSVVIDGRRVRLEFTVVATVRSEGSLPQLVRVRRKDARHRRGAR